MDCIETEGAERGPDVPGEDPAAVALHRAADAADRPLRRRRLGEAQPEQDEAHARPPEESQQAHAHGHAPQVRGRPREDGLQTRQSLLHFPLSIATVRPVLTLRIGFWR